MRLVVTVGRNTLNDDKLEMSLKRQRWPFTREIAVNKAAEKSIIHVRCVGISVL